MKSSYDTIVVGAGLAGACISRLLARRGSVLVLEAQEPASGASGVAAGLVNTLMGRRPRLVWRVDEALEALGDAVTESGAGDALKHGNVVRPARDARQARLYRDAADAHPNHAEWVGPGPVGELYPCVRAPHGAIIVKQGGAVDITAFVHAMLAAAENDGAQVAANVRVTSWGESDGRVWLDAEGHGRAIRLRCRDLVLAVGQGYVRHPELARLPLERIKGQTVRVRVSEPLEDVPLLSGRGYVVPQDAHTLVLGSSYERCFDDLEPSVEQTRYIVDKTAGMVPTVAEAEVVSAQAGARVKVPQSRYPLVDRLPRRRHTWVFTGLGSKGLLMASLLARWLADALEHGRGRLRPEVRLAGRAGR